MATKELRYLTTEEAITLHVLLMREWNEVRFGIDRRDLLESALNRPRQAASFEDADLARQAATLCYGLVKNHPWLGGNKRTATYLMEVFLAMNGSELLAKNDDVVHMVLNIESDRWRVPEVEEWLKENLRSR